MILGFSSFFDDRVTRWSWRRWWLSSLPYTVTIGSIACFAIFRAFHWWTIPAGIAAGAAATGLGALFLLWGDRWDDEATVERDAELAKLFAISPDAARSSVMKWLQAQPDRERIDPSTREQWPTEWHPTLDAVGVTCGFDVAIDFKQPEAKALRRPGFLRVGSTTEDEVLHFWVRLRDGAVYLLDHGDHSDCIPEYPTIWHMLMDRGCGEAAT